MGGPTDKEVLELRNRNEPWLSGQPGVKQTGVELSTKTGEPTLKVYHDKSMTPVIEKSIRARIGARTPIEFHEMKSGDEVIPY